MLCKKKNHKIHKKILFTKTVCVNKSISDLTVKATNKDDKKE
jgi:hypothetical protein